MTYHDFQSRIQEILEPERYESLLAETKKIQTILGGPEQREYMMNIFSKTNEIFSSEVLRENVRVFQNCNIQVASELQKAVSQIDVQEISAVLIEALTTLQDNMAHNSARLNEALLAMAKGIEQLQPTLQGAEWDGILEEISEEPQKSAEEFAEAIKEQIENPIGFQERVANWTEEKKKKHFILWKVLVLVWNVFILPYLQAEVGIPAITKVVSSVKGLPEEEAETTYHLGQGAEAVITENANEYYKVKFVDENGEEKEGFVEKMDLMILEEEETELEKEPER